MTKERAEKMHDQLWDMINEMFGQLEECGVHTPRLSLPGPNEKDGKWTTTLTAEIEYSDKE